MARIAVDIDDTLYSFTQLARQVIAEVASKTDDEKLTHAAYSPWPEWSAPTDLMGLDVWLEIIEMCHTDEMIWNQPPFKGAYEVLWALIDNGHDITYISNRREDSYGATMGWLENHDFPHPGNYDTATFTPRPMDSRVQLICTTGDKKPHIADCQYIIDDRPKTLVEFVYDFDWRVEHPSEPRRGFALHTQYNGALTDVPGVYLAPNWALVGRYLERKGVIEPLSRAL
jgi:hypothetical protein